MSVAYVADSSIFASIVVKDEFYERAKAFVKRFSGSIATLDFALIEVASALWRHSHLLRRVPEERYAQLRGSIKPLIYGAAKVYRAENLVEEALDNAVKLGVTVYDSLYVTLALQERCKLASFDEELRKRLEKAGLKIAVPP